MAEARRAGGHRMGPRAGSLRARPGRARAHATLGQHDLGRVLQVAQVLRLQLVGELLVLHHHVELAVAQPARDVQVRRPDPRPVPVDHRGLGVEHRAVPLVDAHPRLEQRAITGARQGPQDGDVGRPRQQQPHVDALERRGPQGLRVAGGPRVVGVGQPDALAGQGGDELIEPQHPRGRRHARHHAHVHLPGRRRRLQRDERLGQRRPEQLPDVREGALDVGDGRPAELDAGVAPGLEPLGGIAGPRLADAQAGDEADLAVDRDHLAVVARQPAQGRVEARRVVAAHLDAAGAQAVPEPARGFAQAAEPVVDQPHRDAFARLGDEGRGEPLADLVVVDDVALEVDVSARLGDGLEPGRVVLGRVPEQPHAVAADERRPGGPRQRLIGEGAHRT